MQKSIIVDNLRVSLSHDDHARPHSLHVFLEIEDMDNDKTVSGNLTVKQLKSLGRLLTAFAYIHEG